MIVIPYVEQGEKGTISLSSLEIYYIVDHLESTMRSTAMSKPFRLFSNAKTFHADDNQETGLERKEGESQPTTR